LPVPRRATVQAQALAAATTTPEASRASTIAALGPYLPAELQPQVLAAAIGIPDDHSRGHALAGLAPHLPDSLIKQAREAAASAKGQGRVLALAALAPRLSPDDQYEALADALASTAENTSHVGTADDYALGVLVPRLPPSLISEGLEIAASIPDGSSRATWLAELAPYLPASLMRPALEAAVSITEPYPRSRALIGLARYLPAGLVPEATAVATAISDDSHRLEAMAALASRRSVSTTTASAIPATATSSEAEPTQAVTASPENETSSGQGGRPGPTGSILPPSNIAETIAAAAELPDPHDRAHVLAQLAPWLTTDMLAEALTAATSPTNMFASLTLTVLAPYMPSELLAEAISAAASPVTPSHHRNDIIEGVVFHLPAGLLAPALAATSRTSFPASTLKAILRRSWTISPGNEYINLLRSSLAGTDRDTCFEIITEATPNIAAVCGTRAIEECTTAIEDVHRWWP
jgi:hypothetical protein